MGGGSAIIGSNVSRNSDMEDSRLDANAGDSEADNIRSGAFTACSGHGGPERAASRCSEACPNGSDVPRRLTPTPAAADALMLASFDEAARQTLLV